MSKRAGRVVAAAAVSFTVVVGAGVPAQAAETATQTVSFDLGDLDMAGTGQIDQFDPTLGTLTSVKIEAEVAMDFAVCVTNLSEEAAAINTGGVSGAASLSFAGDVVAEIDGAMAVPGTELAAAGSDGCSAWLDGGADPNTPPAGANSSLTASSDSDTWETTITDAADLTPYVGTGTVGFDYTSSSDSALTQPSEWTLAFLASGEGQVRVTYTYEPGAVAGDCEGANPPADCGEVGGEGEGLPNTGGPLGWLVPIGALLVVAGAGMIMVRRPHSA